VTTGDGLGQDVAMRPHCCHGRPGIHRVTAVVWPG
jgi:hypothetical protein